MSVWGWGLLHFRLVRSGCHKSLEGLGSQLFSMCHLGTLEGVYGPCLWLGNSLPESLEQREEEPQRAIGVKNETIVSLGQEELELMA